MFIAKEKHYFDVVSKLFVDRKGEKQTEVHKLLAKLSVSGKAPASAIMLIDTKYKHNESIEEIKSINSNYFITLEIDRTVT